jgi:hypothetical protein
MKLVAITLGIAFCSWSWCAAAQDIAPDCPATPADEAQAKRLASAWFKTADNLFKKENYNWALGALMCSYRLFEHPVTLYNAVQAAIQADRKEDALRLAQLCVHKDPYGKTAQEAKILIEELERELSDQPAGQPAEQPEEQPGEQPAGQPAEQPGEPTAPAPSDDSTDLATAGYVALALGGVAAVAGGVFQGITASMHKESQETDDPKVFVSKRDTGEKMQMVAIAGFIVGGVAIGAGITLVLLDGGDDDEAAVALAPGPGGLTLTGRF